MTTDLPRTPEEILKTAEIDPEYANREKKPESASFFDLDVPRMKKLLTLHAPKYRQELAATRPEELDESEHHITLRDGFSSRILLCHKSVAPTDGKAPLIILFHGGAFCFGSPEMELKLARELALNLNAVVICPSYRLAPEHPFPCGINDCWDTVQWAAAEVVKSESSVLPTFADAYSGFIVGGSSAGAGISAVLAHLSRDNNLRPPLTGQALFAGSCISEHHVPPKYQARYLSRKQNANATQNNAEQHYKFREALNPDYASPFFAAFDQHHPDDGEGEVARGHVGLCPAYFQACGMDASRDDALIYESVLREESGVLTRIDLYRGLPHCWWAFYPAFESSKRRLKDTVQGVKWLLENVPEGH